MNRQIETLYIVTMVLCIVLESKGQIPQQVCQMNSTTKKCQQDPDAIIQLLTNTGYDFAYMLRCEFATSQNACNNMSNNTCIWAQESCHVSARYLVDTISQCLSGNYLCNTQECKEGGGQLSQNKCQMDCQQGNYFFNTLECKQGLEDWIGGHEWIDARNMNVSSQCWKNQQFFELGTCEMINNLLSCSVSNQKYCSGNTDNNIGYLLSSDIRVLFQIEQSQRILSIEYLENMLNIKRGNLQIYQYCDTLNSSSCKNVNKSPEELIPHLPRIKQAQLPLIPPQLLPQKIIPLPPPPPPQLKLPICKWIQETQTCVKNPLALINLLSDTNSTFGNMMKCSVAESENQCKYLSNNSTSCVWNKNSCHISSSYLVNSVIECFFPQSNGNLVNLCISQLQNIIKQYRWISQDKVSQANLCYHSIDNFQFKSSSCKLLEVILQCGQQGCGSVFGYSFDFCDISPNNLTQQISTDLTYIMNENSNAKNLKLSYLEKSLNILEGNLQLYDNCQYLKNQNECESSVVLPSPNQPEQEVVSSGDEKKAGIQGLQKMLLVVLTVPLVLVPICLYVIFRKGRLGIIPQQQQLQRQDDSNRLAQMTTLQLQDGEVIGLRTQNIIDNLPTIEYKRVAGTSLQTCTICLDEIIEGKKESTVLPCMHWFHRNCFEKWIQIKGSQVTCPLCNQRLLDNLT